MTSRERHDVVVVGGGLSGLATAAALARAGGSVTLFEKSRELGGRAVTHISKGFHFNLGPHALYRGGRAAEVLRRLGVPFTGGVPSGVGYAFYQGRLHTLPAGPWSLLRTNLFGARAKLEGAPLLASLGNVDSQAILGLSVEAWLQKSVRSPEVRELLKAFFRLATYADEPQRQSAGAALGQLQLALKSSVYYLDGGWQRLVEGLYHTARLAGVEVVTNAKVASVEHDAAVRGVLLADGAFHEAACVAVAASPQKASSLVDSGRHPVLARWAQAAVPVRAASLDLALGRLPRPRTLFALGIDRPLYFSVHSAVAHLAPAGGATVHAAKYLRSDAVIEPAAVASELEAWLDLLQPGWRGEVIERRFLPQLTVSNGLVTAAQGGTPGRPGPEVPGLEGLYVVGDWVGAEGMLADAALASATLAAERIAEAGGIAGRVTG